MKTGMQKYVKSSDALDEFRGPLPDDLDDLLEKRMPGIKPEMLVAALMNPKEDPDARCAMARGVFFLSKSAFGDYRGAITSALRCMLSDANGGLRIVALNTLSAMKVNDPETLAAIRKLTNDRNVAVRRNATHRLAELSG